MKEDLFDVAVIGAGGAGTMAHLRNVLSSMKSVLFLGDASTKRKGRATWVSEVDNIPGMHEMKNPITKTSSATLKWLQDHSVLRSYSYTIKAKVDRLEGNMKEGFSLSYTENGETKSIKAKFVIAATGVMDVQPRIQGDIAPVFPFANRGDFIYCVRCDGHRTIGKKLSIIGYQDTAIEIGAMMMERYQHDTVSILTHGETAQFSDQRFKLAEAYEMRIFSSPIHKILEGEDGSLSGFLFKDGSRLDCEKAIISLGVIPYNELLIGMGAKVDEVGKAVVSEKFESSCEGLFVVGDLVSGKKMQIYTGWDEAVDASDEINRRIRHRIRERKISQKT